MTPFGLRSRIIAGYVVLAVITLTASVVLVRHMVAQIMVDELLTRGRECTVGLAGACVQPVLLDDRVALMKLAARMSEFDEQIEYAMIVDQHRAPVAHTMPGRPSRQLIGANWPSDGSPCSHRALDTVQGAIYDFAAPILGGQLGFARVGLSTRRIKETVDYLTLLIVGLVALLAAAGLGVLAFVASRGLRPLEELTVAALEIREGRLDASVPGSGVAEIGELCRAFALMQSRIREHIEGLRASQERIRYLNEYNENLLNHMRDGICVVGPDHRVQYVNEQMRREVGLNVGELCYEVIRGLDSSCDKCAVQELMETGEPVVREHETLNGRVYDVLHVPLRNTDGTKSVLERWRDVTDQVILQRQLAQAERLAAVGELAAGVAHDINNPLDWLHNCMDLLDKRRGQPEEFKALTGLVREGLVRIEMIVRRLLALSRQSVGAKEPTHLSDMVERSVFFVRHRIDEKGAVLETELEPGLPEIEANASDLSQALINLLLNAADAVDGDGVVQLRAVKSTDHQGEVQIEVRDNGGGIEAEALDSIFEPFFTTKAEREGTGLGLSLCKKIVEEHGGRISVHSQLGQGTVFTINLPVKSHD